MGGAITSFDGDRVMGIFVEGSKNTNAAKAALQINYCVDKIINPAIKNKFSTTDYVVKQAVGIDTSTLHAVRTGIRNNNDLVWIGKSANYAAKLCSFRKPGKGALITSSVYSSLLDTSKYGGTENRLMWDSFTWDETGETVYGSSWNWEP